MKDITLCMDDWFPKCDGTKTHPLQLSEIMKIPVVKAAIKDLIERAEPQEIARSFKPDYKDGNNEAIRLFKQNLLSELEK